MPGLRQEVGNEENKNTSCPSFPSRSSCSDYAEGGIWNSCLINTAIKTVYIIVGPTASGKTAAAIRLAQQYKTAIISADSRQCYRELNIGVARPSPEELKAIPHYFIATHSITETVTAATFEQYALETAEMLFKKHDTIVMTGGTGLYIKAFCEGLDDIPETDPGIRQQIEEQFKQHGITWLQEEIRNKDPLFYTRGEIKNPRRLARALEVVESTGRSILDFRKGEKVKRPFTIIKKGIDLPKEILHRNIHDRVDRMIAAGLVDEVKSLIPYRHLPALQTVGYSEIFAYLDGEYSLQTAVEKIKTNTRQYAKRQMTWFRKDREIDWEELRVN